MNITYPHLMEPLTVGNVTFRNRLFSAPQGLHVLQDSRTYPTQAVIANMANKARGGAALVTCHTTATASRADGSGADTDYDIFDAVSRQFIGQMAEEIHFYGAKASMELNFLTGPAGYDVCDGLIGLDGQPTKAIPREKLEELAENYATQAYICKYLGFDMVMLHMGYQFSMMARFLSPRTNTRTDEFGGSAENRARFGVMICDAIHRACGSGFPIEIRMSGSEETPGGQTLEDAVAFAHAFAGHADLLQIHGPDGASSHCMGFQDKYPFTGWAETVKRAEPGIRIVTIGGFQDMDDAERVLASGKADAIAIGRGFIADPNLGVKAREGRNEDIVPCVKCMRCHDTACVERVTYRCSVNPTIGLEHKLERLVQPARQGKKVAVVGGGPAGMNAALTAAQRGHTVTLYEASDHLGGQLVFSDYVAFKASLSRYKNYLVRQVEKANITVLLNTRADRALLEAAGYDAVLAALGAAPVVPGIPGVEGANVLTAPQVYGHEAELVQDVVVIGGGQVGCETAMHLALCGHSVTLLELQAKLAPDASSSYRYALLTAMGRQQNLRAITRARCTSLEGGVHFTVFGMEQVLPAGSIVLAAGMKAKADEARGLYGAAQSVELIGDCGGPGNLAGATRTGYAAAVRL